MSEYILKYVHATNEISRLGKLSCFLEMSLAYVDINDNLYKNCLLLWEHTNEEI